MTSLTLDFAWKAKEATEAALATPIQIRAATRSALARTARHAQTIVRAAAAKLAKVPQGAIKGRFYRHLSRSHDTASIWAGTYNIRLSQLGTPRQTKTGVRLGRMFFPGAFVGRGKLEGRGIFIRYRSRHFDPNLYRKPGPGMSDSILGATRSPFRRRAAADPIVRALGKPIQAEVEQAFADNEAAIREFFIREFDRNIMHTGRLPWAKGIGK